KGHASPLCYAMFRAAGAITDEELLTFRKIGSRLEGHPTPVLPWVDVATGSLGQGLPIAVGVALAGKRLDRLPYHVWALCGDSELAEGSIWEGIDKAGYYGLDNFTAIFDVNRLGQRGVTELGWDLEAYRRRAEAFGGRAVVIDGHDVEQIDAALAEARRGGDRPTVVIARTVKGKGFSEIEDREGWHGRALPADMAERAIAELGGVRHITVPTGRPEPADPTPPGPPARTATEAPPVALPTYRLGEKVPTRKAFGDALKALGALPDVVALDGEVGNSTHVDEFAEAYPDRFFEMFIAEQMLVAAAVGMSVRGYRPFAATFAAFFTRAYDFIRMAAISQASIRLVGSHAGVEIGQDGPSQMGLEDLAAMRAVQGSTVLYPADATSAARLTALMADTEGIVFLRTTRGGYPVLYGPDEEFAVGGAKVVRRSGADRVALIGAGVTLHNCLAAADELAADGIAARVIDLYSVKPVDVGTLREASEATGGRLVVAEDHYPQGGLGSAVMEALAGEPSPPRVVQCAVGGLPASGRPDELMEAAGISAAQIAAAARRLVEA
ncbi:MAG TPA: transketolase, partial [Candidatus Dormibacteraeota bacterium]|nr:transketolase [Candidatus Dormibacteraeota bacterium]